MTQNLKLAFKNTLWFLLPSGIIFLVIIALNIYWGFSGVAAWRVLSDGYYFLLLPNIPFFIASIVLFVFLQKNSSRLVSVIVSNGVVIGSYFLTFYLSQFISQLGDIGFGGILLLAIAILALIIFFIRSITARYEFVTNAENIEITRLPSGTNKFLVYGLVIFIIVSVVLIMGWLYLPLFLR